jgi:hypothetical protein
VEGADGAAEKLVAEADAEDGDFAEHALEGFDRVIQRGGIAGAVGDEEAVGAMLHDFFGGDIGGEDGDLHAALAEVAEDVVLGAAIEGDDVQAVAALDFAEGPVALVLIPVVFAFGLDGLYPVGADHLAACLARSTSLASSRISVERIPRIAPLMRSMRVRARVSMPSMPMMLLA